VWENNGKLFGQDVAGELFQPVAEFENPGLELGGVFVTLNHHKHIVDMRVVGIGEEVALIRPGNDHLAMTLRLVIQRQSAFDAPFEKRVKRGAFDFDGASVVGNGIRACPISPAIGQEKPAITGIEAMPEVKP
jgi:hypothetical protein